jgi:D-alanyl-lipoteichoic acid acyltransferase DltB (MBOAT superfamily)
MLFNSGTFLVFFLILLFLSFLCPQKFIKQLLLVASLIFYAWWYPPYLLMLFVLVYLDYFCCLKIEQARNSSYQASFGAKHYLWLSVILHLVILFGFKYLHFFFSIFGYSLPSNFHWSLPLGISFITFHTLSCTIDVYRAEHQAPQKYSDLLYYVCFFPHLIAGPILRLKDHWKDIINPSKPSLASLNSGIYLIFWGLAKKMIIADNLAPFVEKYFDHPESISGTGIAWLALYAFAVQIYCDFSGYIDTALGIAKIFSVKLPDNFDYPYLSRSITDFWRRWHITLSAWLRDYLYIPLGGNRHGSLMTYRNLMLTMLLGGLWHGANWTFVVWGGLHGLYLSVEKYFSCKVNQEKTVFQNLWKYFICFHAVCFAWIFFRAKDFSRAFEYTTSLFDLSKINQGLGSGEDVSMALIMIFTLVVHVLNYKLQLKNKLNTMPLSYRMAYLVSLIVLIILFGVKQEARFIYFDF